MPEYLDTATMWVKMSLAMTCETLGHELLPL